MKINNVSGVMGAYTQHQARKVARTQASTPPERNDEVRLSREAQDILTLKDKVAQAPDVRRERIEELRRQIEAGTYRPSARQIADRMLKARVFDEMV